MSDIKYYKLIDKEGYLDCNPTTNIDYLGEYSVTIQGVDYYKGYIDEYKDLMDESGNATLIACAEFCYFEEVDSIPLPKEKPLLDKCSVSPLDTFTKEGLISGKHIVETREGGRYLVAGDYLISDVGYNNLNDRPTLKSVTHNLLDIVKVYSGGDEDGIYCTGGFKKYLHHPKLELIWQEESPEEAAKRIKKLELEKKLIDARNTVKVLEDELSEM